MTVCHMCSANVHYQVPRHMQPYNVKDHVQPCDGLFWPMAYHPHRARTTSTIIRAPFQYWRGTHPNQTTVPLPARKCKTDAAGRASASNIRSAAAADEMLTPTCNAPHNGVPCQAWTACVRTCSNAVINSYFGHLCILDGQELHVGEDTGTGRGALRA